MNQQWSDKNKKIQTLLNREDTFREAIDLLLELRLDIFNQITSIMNGYPDEAFYQMPFANSDGYHSKTLSYSVWHIFRIEDIVAHTMIANDEQVFFASDYKTKINSPIITTGNELSGDGIAEFSKQLDRWQLYNYAKDVYESTNNILRSLTYSDLKRTFREDTRTKLIESGCVSEDESAAWLISYWCGKNVKGLLKMPFSRHHIMHVEAMGRICNKLCKGARKGTGSLYS